MQEYPDYESLDTTFKGIEEGLVPDSKLLEFVV
jgi:hypothetical protein